jgi:hypothetical protein
MYVFIDESGDLGFHKEKIRSAYFVITALVCTSKKTRDLIKRAIERTLKNKINHRKNNKRKSYEIKGSASTIEIKKYFFNELPKTGWHLYSLILDKNTINKPLTSKEKIILYDKLTSNLISQIEILDKSDSIWITIDRSKSKNQILKFNESIKKNLTINSNSVNISHISSHEDYGLQAVDLFCWGIMRYVELKDNEWYSTYNNSIILLSYYEENKDGPIITLFPELVTSQMEGSTPGIIMDLPV